MTKVLIKKMITELLLILPLYLTLFLIWWQFRHLIEAIAGVENILNDDYFFGDTVDTPKESIEQHRKGERLKDALSKGKVLGSKRHGYRKKLIRLVTKL